MERLVIFGGSLNPPGKNHYRIAQRLLEEFGRLLVVPCGNQRGKKALYSVTEEQRKNLIHLTFGNLPNMALDFSDLETGKYTPTIRLFERYRKIYPCTELWFAVGGDIIAGGQKGQSEIQQEWVEGQGVWRELNFVVIDHPGFPIQPADLPPHALVLPMENFYGRATLVRQRLAMGQSINDLVLPEVASYILQHRLYRNEVSA